MRTRYPIVGDARRAEHSTAVPLCLVAAALLSLIVASSASAADGPPAKPSGPIFTKTPGVSPAEKQREKAIAAALAWLRRHQSQAGNWSFKEYQKQCKDKTCTGPGSQESLSAATALGILPFLAAGQSHLHPGPYQRTVMTGIYWLILHQKPDGDLSAGADQQMYSHGLAAIALCDDYEATHDKAVGKAAQQAINFIEAAQNAKTGGWRYHPGDEGDTSVLGFQLTALESGRLAGLKVKPATFAGARKFLASTAKLGADGKQNGTFAYQPEDAATPTMSAVGILCEQYLKADRSGPLIVGGEKYLMAHQPDPNDRNIYYWIYATQAMHNMADQDWVAWNSKMSKILIDTQAHQGCAAGSWSPDLPLRDAWGPVGGRVMITSLSCLTLEVYYRYLPTFKLDKPAARKEKK